MSSTAITTDQVKPQMLVTRAGLQLRTLDEVWRFATCLAKSGLAPKGIETPEAITIAVQMGMEVGLPPMAAMQNIAVINGRPSIWGDAQLAVVRGTGELEIFDEWFEADKKRLARNPTEYKDDTTAVCRVKRTGYEPQESGYSVADAKRAGLWDKAGPWKQVPFRMLRMRARSFALRDAFGDALRGLMTAEEAQDLPPKEVSGRVVETARPQLFGPKTDVAPFPLDSLPPTIPGTSAGSNDAASPSNGAVGTDSPPAGEDRQADSAKLGHASEPSGAETTRPNQGLGAAGAQTQAPSHEQGSQQPLKGTTPARRTAPKAETLTLDNADTETCKERLERRINQFSLDRFKIEETVKALCRCEYDDLSEEQCAKVLKDFDSLKEACAA